MLVVAFVEANLFLSVHECDFFFGGGESRLVQHIGSSELEIFVTSKVEHVYC